VYWIRAEISGHVFAFVQYAQHPVAQAGRFDIAFRVRQCKAILPIGIADRTSPYPQCVRTLPNQN